MAVKWKYVSLHGFRTLVKKYYIRRHTKSYMYALHTSRTYDIVLLIDSIVFYTEAHLGPIKNNLGIRYNEFQNPL